MRSLDLQRRFQRHSVMPLLDREITLTSDMLDHVGLPRGGKLVANQLPDGTIALRAKRKWSSTAGADQSS